jgi:hypothetical protein
LLADLDLGLQIAKFATETGKSQFNVFITYFTHKIMPKEQITYNRREDNLKLERVLTLASSLNYVRKFPSCRCRSKIVLWEPTVQCFYNKS